MWVVHRVLGTVLGLMHLYVWKRLIKDTTTGRLRAALSAALVALFVLLVATLLLPRLLGWRGSSWLAWPGYVWFGLIAYLFLSLVVLEPVRLVFRRWVKRERANISESHGSAVNRRVFLARASAVAAGAAPRGPIFARGQGDEEGEEEGGGRQTRHLR